MRKIILFLCLVCMLLTVTVGASAETAAKSVSGFATVSSDGSCQVTLTANIHLDQPVEALKFPLPGEAREITVNGSKVKSVTENGLRQIDISAIIGKMAGDFTLTFTYTLPQVVTTNSAGLLQLQLPLLSGFAYPVQALEFSVTLPGPVGAKPAFSSGYHQANIEKDIYFTTDGATIRGISQVELKDHETLEMTLLVSREMFPEQRVAVSNFETVHMLSLVFALLAVVYWALFLRNLPGWPVLHRASPDGYGAGELGSILHLKGCDLHMMVFSWAQRGYLLIQAERDGKFRLFRQMDMGNECSAFEQKCFRLLFGKMRYADSRRYGAAYRAVEKLRPNVADLVHRKSGNLSVFRALAALTAMFVGVSIGAQLTEDAALQGLLMVAFGLFALVSGWYMQQWARFLITPRRERFWFSLFLGSVWVLLGLLAGKTGAGIGLCLGQLAFGVLLAIGGRRTPAGKQAMAQTLGLRRYLRTVDTEQLRQICRNNPEYFHQMMPYALALGVDKAFAGRFGKMNVGQCPYIFAGAESTMRAEQWQVLMRRVLANMSAQPEQSRIEKVLSFLQRIRQ